MKRRITPGRSLVKAVTYRILIMSLDFATIYLFTGTARIAFGFMVASNVYTTIGYILHERIWARIGWGIQEPDANPNEHGMVSDTAAQPYHSTDLQQRNPRW